MLQNFTTAVRQLQRTFSDAFNPYRPELYYMRGPGPACLAEATPKRHPVTARATKGFPATASPPRLALRDEAQVKRKSLRVRSCAPAPQLQARQQRRLPRLSFPVSPFLGLSLRLDPW